LNRKVEKLKNKFFFFSFFLSFSLFLSLSQIMIPITSLPRRFHCAKVLSASTQRFFSSSLPNLWRHNIRGDKAAQLFKTPRSLESINDGEWYSIKKNQILEKHVDISSGKLIALPGYSWASQVESTQEGVERLLDTLENTWILTEAQFGGLISEEAFYTPPSHRLRHPMIFYFGHTPAVFVNKLRVAGLLDQPIHAFFEKHFETGVDEMRWDDMNKNDEDWPSINDVVRYRHQVFQVVRDVIIKHYPDFHQKVVKQGVISAQQHPLWAVFLGIEHEHIHFETSSVLIRELPQSLVRPVDIWPEPHTDTSPTSLLGTSPKQVCATLKEVAPARVQLGKAQATPTFGWDNEYGQFEQKVEAFSASQYMITNGQFLEFVRDQGYMQQKYWDAEGWAWRSYNNTKWPHFWQPMGPTGLNQYVLRTNYTTLDCLPADWPADVNYYEAKAYCRWLEHKTGKQGLRILTEMEHTRLLDITWDALDWQPSYDPVYHWDSAALRNADGQQSTPFNFNFAYGSQRPVNTPENATLPFGDVMGNNWEWAEDHFAPLPNFNVHPYYEDFSMPCFDGQHHRIVGGSFMSLGNLASKYARYHFRPHFFQHAGFRLVQGSSNNHHLSTVCMNCSGPYAGKENPYRLSDDSLRDSSDESKKAAQKYEDDEVLHQYLHMHYAPADDECAFPPGFVPEAAKRFPQRCAQMLVDAMPKQGKQTVLDIGCAVGGSSFELAKTYEKVVAFDISDQFIHMANHLRTGHQIDYHVRAEGDRRDSFVATAPSDVDVSRLNFTVDDATALDVQRLGGPFDGILCANVICRLPSSKPFFEVLPSLIKPGGRLVLTTPFSWLPQHTPVENWLGGTDQEESIDALKKLMKTIGFNLIETQDMPFVIREHRRKYEYVVALASIWEKC